MKGCVVPLAITTPTRRRWKPWMHEQARRLAEQMADDDVWVIVADNDPPDEDTLELIERHIGGERLILAQLGYARPVPPVAIVNRLRNVAAALAPPYDLVELDDHDLLEPGALDAIRRAFADSADYIFGWQKQDAVLLDPCGAFYLEAWPRVEHAYHRGCFTDGSIDAIGLRAIRRTLWDALGGWWLDVWPGGDRDLAERAEQAGAKIVCLPQSLCTVVVNDETGLSYLYRVANRQ